MARNDKEYIEELLGELQLAGVEIFKLQRVVRVVKQWREHVVEESGSATDCAIDKLLADAYDYYLETRDK